MRSYHRRPSEKDPTSEVLGVLRNPDLKFDAVRARLNWLVAMLWDKDERFQMIGPTFIVDELQRLIDTKSARSLLSTYVASTVGDLSIVFECINQVELYQPWAQKHGSQTNKERDDMLNEMKAYVKIWQDSANAIDKKDSTLGSLGRPTDGKFAYPVAKRRTRENVELMRQAERNLDKFWERLTRTSSQNAAALLMVLFCSRKTEHCREHLNGLSPYMKALSQPSKSSTFPYLSCSLTSRHAAKRPFLRSLLNNPGRRSRLGSLAIQRPQQGRTKRIFQQAKLRPCHCLP